VIVISFEILFNQAAMVFFAISTVIFLRSQVFSNSCHHTSGSGIVFLLSHNLLYFGYGSDLQLAPEKTI
jgi:hypothetical protein